MNLQKMCQFKAGVWLIILSAWIWATPASAQWSKQTVSLNPGWNAIYLQVEPADSSCETVFAGWPVSSVSLYNMERTAVQYVNNPDEPQNIDSEFMTWIPGQPAGVNELNSVIAGQSYLVNSTAACQRVLTGRPAVPRIEWLPGTNVYNLVGFRQNGAAKFGSYLAGAGFNAAKVSIYSVGGTNTRPTPLPVGGFSGGFSTVPIEQGKAYFISCDKISSFSGPVKAYPAGTGGLIFPTNSAYQTVRLKNENGSPLTVTLALTNSAAAPSGAVPVLPAIQYFEYLQGWLPLTPGVQRTLQAGEEWTLPLAVDRTGMAEGQLWGGILVATDTAGGRIEIPMEVQYSKPDPTQALWPAGLWVGKASLNKVSQVLGDGTIINGSKAGSTLNVRLILHVAVSGECRLLQRVIISGSENESGNWTPSLYVDEADVPADMKSVRISSVGFGVKNDIQWDQSFGAFGNRLRFAYAIAADDSVNPFRHPYHPDHNGLDFDFKTKLPTGDNPQNYIGEKKPETFSLSNTVSLVWTAASGTNSGSAFWNPAEKVTGEVSFQVDGLRKEGTVLMQGQFELRRISQVGQLSTE